MLFQCWSSAVGGGPIVKKHWVKSSRLLGSTQVSVYTHPSPTIIFSPANQGTFSKTAGQSQAYYNTWNWERGTYDVNHLHILTCEVAVYRVGSVVMTVRKMSWACDLVAVLIRKNYFSTWLFEGKPLDMTVQRNVPRLLYGVNLRLKPVSQPSQNLCITFVQRWPNWPNIVQMLYKCLAFNGNHMTSGPRDLQIHLPFPLPGNARPHRVRSSVTGICFDGYLTRPQFSEDGQENRKLIQVWGKK